MWHQSLLAFWRWPASPSSFCHCCTKAQTHININVSHSAPTPCAPVIGRGRRARILIDANPDEPTDTLPQRPRPLFAAQLATISLLLAVAVLRLRRGGGLHCQGAPLICYISQGYGRPRLTGPWRHKPRPPWRLSANPDAWHRPNRPTGAIQEPWMSMICFHRGQFQLCGISMNERNVFFSLGVDRQTAAFTRFTADIKGHLSSK